jgi:hypothetical protein
MDKFSSRSRFGLSPSIAQRWQHLKTLGVLLPCLLMLTGCEVVSAIREGLEDEGYLYHTCDVTYKAQSQNQVKVFVSDQCYGGVCEGMIPFNAGGKYNIRTSPPTGGKWGFMNSNHILAIKPEFDGIHCFSEGLAWVARAGKTGYINKAGQLIIPSRFDGGLRFSEGLAAVVVNDKWGFINREGKVVIPFKFNDVLESFNQGNALVVIGKQRFRLDKTGTLTPQ